MSNQRIFIASLAILGLAISGCSGDPESEEEPFPLDTPREQTTTPDEGSTESPTAAPTNAVPELPRECSDVIRYVDVLDAVAVPLSGGVSPIFVDGGFHEASGRLQRLTCSYFADTAGDDEDEDAEQPPPVLEIAVSSYVDAASASARVADTVAGGSQVEPLEVAGAPGYVLTGEETITFVVALEHLTYVASLRRGVVPESAEPVVLIGLAEHLVGGDDTATDG